jgi:hypothetical protein
VLFLDNFENLTTKDHFDETASEIVQLMKSLADRSADGGPRVVKVVVAGVPAASEELLDVDPATERRIKQIEVPKMPPNELDEILKNGEAELKISFEGFCRERILAYSDGFPYYTHLFALHTSRRAIDDGREHVTLEDFEDALDAILADCSLSLRKAYDRAVETSGEVQTRKSIMEAMEPLKQDYSILVDKGLAHSSNNTYSFANPLMRAYVKLRALKERQGVLEIQGVPTEISWPPDR